MGDQPKIRLKAVDFFCGPGGMSYGLSQAGITLLGGIDNDVDCRDTYLKNIPSGRFIKHDICTLSAPELGRRLHIERDDPSLIFAGCSPCQFWSKIRTDRSKSVRTAFLLHQFQRFIHHFRPGFIVIENVPGLLTRRNHSILPGFIKFLGKCGYQWQDGIINAVNYGVPQNRKRYLLIGTRVSGAVALPPPETNPHLTVRSFIGLANGFQRIAAGHNDPSDFQHTASSLSTTNLQRIRLTAKSGGNRSAWKDNENLQIPAYRGKDEIFRDVYGRMYWERPAPTITTRFNSFSNGRFGHPDEDRAISIREGATLQTFPKCFIFHGSSQNSVARQIGNAVPPELARRIGIHLINLASNG